MRLSNPAILFSLWLFAVMAVTGCGTSVNDTGFLRPDIAKRASDIPFPSVEPERYSAEVIVTGDGFERRYFIARDGLKQRIEFDQGTDRHKIFIRNTGYLIIDPKKRSFAEKPVDTGQTFPAEFISDLTQQLLTARSDTEFEFVRTADDRDIYKAVINDSTVSETLVYVDKAMKMPVKTEYYQVNGESKTLTVSTEIRNFKTEVDENMFAVPSGYRKAAYDSVLK